MKRLLLPFSLALLLTASAPAQSAAEWVERARQAEAESRWDEALSAWDRAAQLYRQGRDGNAAALALFYRGRLLFQARRLDEALAPLGQARDLFQAAGAAKGVALVELQLGTLELERQHYPEAEAHLRRSMAAAESGGDAQRRWEALERLAGLLDIAHRWPEASALQEQLLEHRRGSGAGPAEIAETLVTLAALQQVQNRNQAALDCYNQALELRPDVDTLARRARLFLNLRRYPEALADYQRLLQEQPGDWAYGCNQAYALEQSGRSAEAEQAYRALLQIRPDPAVTAQLAGLLQRTGRQPEAVQLLASLPAAERGRQLEQLGLLAEAEAALRQAGDANSLGLFLIRQDRALEARQVYQTALLSRPQDPVLLGNLAETYLSRHEYAQALQPLEQAVAQTREQSLRQASLLNSLASAQQELGRWSEGLASLRRASALADAFQSPDPIQGTIANSLGYTYVQLGSLEQGIQAYQKALSLRRSQHDRNGEAVTLNNLGAAYLAQGQRHQAAEAYSQALELSPGPVLQATLENNLAQLETDPEQARRRYLRVLATVDGQSHPDQRGVALANLSRLSGRDGAQERAWADEAFALFQRTGSRQRLLDLLPHYLTSARPLPDGSSALSLQPDLLEELVRGLPSRLARSFVDDRRADLEWGVASAPDPAGRFVAEERIRALGVLALTRAVDLNYERLPAELRERLKTLEMELAAGSAPADLKRAYQEACNQAEQHDLETGRLLQARAVDATELQAALGAGEVVIEYVRLPQRWSALLIDRRSLVEVDLGDRQTLERSVQQLRRGLRPDAPQTPLEEQLSEVSTRLWSPLENRLPAGTRRLIFLPSGSLFTVPMAALPRQGRPLIEHFELESSSSATAWLLSRRSRCSGRGQLATALGRYSPAWQQRLSALPGTLREVARLGKLFPGTLSLREQGFTSAALERSLSGRRLIHFATHGLLDPNEPLLGGLAASDRLIRVSDIFQWHLDARLVVLSACNTGKISEGKEYVGLTRAFQHAGAGVLVATLWPVADDATALWMESFYARLARGQNLSSAHRQATLATRRRYPHPYFWAPCVLWGDGRRPL